MLATNQPAAGEKGGPAPLLASLQVPDFMRLQGDELNTTLNVLRDPLVSHLYLLLLVQMRYTDGEFIGSYARLIDLCTPPRPERGLRRAGPTYKQVRRALADLEAVKLVYRAETNAAQGQLRLFLAPRKNVQKPKIVLVRPKK